MADPRKEFIDIKDAASQLHMATGNLIKAFESYSQASEKQARSTKKAKEEQQSATKGAKELADQTRKLKDEVDSSSSSYEKYAKVLGTASAHMQGLKKATDVGVAGISSLNNSLAASQKMFGGSLKTVSDYQNAVYLTGQKLNVFARTFRTVEEANKRYEQSLERLRTKTNLSTKESQALFDTLSGGFRGFRTDTAVRGIENLAIKIKGLGGDFETTMKKAQSLSDVFGQFRTLQQAVEQGDAKKLAGTSAFLERQGAISRQAYEDLLSLSSNMVQGDGGTRTGVNRLQRYGSSTSEFGFQQQMGAGQNSAVTFGTDLRTNAADMLNPYGQAIGSAGAYGQTASRLLGAGSSLTQIGAQGTAAAGVISGSLGSSKENPMFVEVVGGGMGDGIAGEVIGEVIGNKLARGGVGGTVKSLGGGALSYGGRALAAVPGLSALGTMGASAAPIVGGMAGTSAVGTAAGSIAGSGAAGAAAVGAGTLAAGAAAFAGIAGVVDMLLDLKKGGQGNNFISDMVDSLGGDAIDSFFDGMFGIEKESEDVGLNINNIKSNLESSLSPLKDMYTGIEDVEASFREAVVEANALEQALGRSAQTMQQLMYYGLNGQLEKTLREQAAAFDVRMQEIAKSIEVINSEMPNMGEDDRKKAQIELNKLAAEELEIRNKQGQLRMQASTSEANAALEIQRIDVETARVIRDRNKAARAGLGVSYEDTLRVAQESAELVQVLDNRASQLEAQSQQFAQEGQDDLALTAFQEARKLRNEARSAEKDYFEEVKAIREGYLDAMKEQIFGAGGFAKIIPKMDQGNQMFAQLAQIGGQGQGLQTAGKYSTSGLYLDENAGNVYNNLNRDVDTRIYGAMQAGMDESQGGVGALADSAGGANANQVQENMNRRVGVLGDIIQGAVGPSGAIRVEGLTVGAPGVGVSYPSASGGYTPMSNAPFQNIYTAANGGAPAPNVNPVLGGMGNFGVGGPSTGSLLGGSGGGGGSRSGGGRFRLGAVDDATAAIMMGQQFEGLSDGGKAQVFADLNNTIEELDGRFDNLTNTIEKNEEYMSTVDPTTMNKSSDEYQEYLNKNQQLEDSKKELEDVNNQRTQARYVQNVLSERESLRQSGAPNEDIYDTASRVYEGMTSDSFGSVTGQRAAEEYRGQTEQLSRENAKIAKEITPEMTSQLQSVLNTDATGTELLSLANAKRREGVDLNEGWTREHYDSVMHGGGTREVGVSEREKNELSTIINRFALNEGEINSMNTEADRLSGRTTSAGSYLDADKTMLARYQLTKQQRAQMLEHRKAQFSGSQQRASEFRNQHENTVFSPLDSMAMTERLLETELGKVNNETGLVDTYDIDKGAIGRSAMAGLVGAGFTGDSGHTVTGANLGGYDRNSGQFTLTVHLQDGDGNTVTQDISVPMSEIVSGGSFTSNDSGVTTQS